MAKIKILPEKVARKIAAGEVIERPASVVKELCENAFDAQAQNISVELRQGGLSLIRVQDDGHGMSPEDLKICFLPHATSKISSEEDLFKIATWGFRGEALASIAAVAELVISSRAKEALLGGRVRVRYGKLLSFTEKGLPPGTTVEVKNLFGNVPARKAFLKSPRAEAARVVELMKLLAFERPSSNLFLKLNERKAFQYQASQGRLGLLAESVGLKEEAFAVETFEKPPFRLETIMTFPRYTFPTSRHIYFLVNNRVVKDKLLASAILEGIKSAYPRGRYPALLLALDLPPELVDVNVHPAKWEVRFRQEREVYALVKRAVENLTKPKISFSLPEAPAEESPAEDLPLMPPSPVLKVAEPPPSYALSPFPGMLKPEAEVLGPFGAEFYLLKDGDRLVFFDFHAAQERLIFEELKETLAQDGGLKKQVFLTPEPLKLTGQALTTLEENLSLLENLGFELEALAPGEFFLRAAPAILGFPAAETLKSILEEIPAPEASHFLDEMLARLACKAAKRAGELLSDAEILHLYSKIKEKRLERCPHGRPISWSISLEEVRKKLGRTL